MTGIEKCFNMKKSSFFFSFFLSFSAYGNHKKCWNDIHFNKTERMLSRHPLRISPLEIGRESDFLFFDIDYKNPVRGFFKVKKTDDHNMLSPRRLYLFSRLMDFKLVPPTSILMCHTVQLYIDKNSMENKIKFLTNKLSDTQKSDVYIFYFLFGYLDLNFGNILIGKNCNRPALVDNDALNISMIQIGDYPFEPLKKNLLYTLEDFQQFPFHKVKSKKVSSVFELGDWFRKHKMYRHEDMNYIKLRYQKLEDKTLYYIDYKKTLFLKRNRTSYGTIYHSMVPKSVSKKTLKHLKKINRSKLEKIFKDTDRIQERCHFEKTPNNFKESYKESYINMVLYRKEVLLKHLEKLPKH